MTARLRRLRAEVASDRAATEAHFDRLAAIALDGDVARSALAAWTLHHAYSAVEALLERVARTVEGGVPEGADWHKALLDDAALDIEGVRPRLLSPDVVRALHDLRAFRHFVRHAYGVDLDAQELRTHQVRVAALRPHLLQDLDALDAWLAALIAAAAE